MADNAPSTDPATRRPVHPFFAQKRTTIPIADEHLEHNASTSSGKPPDGNTDPNPAARRGRRRKADQQTKKEQTDMNSRPRKRTRNSAGEDIQNHFVNLAKGRESKMPNDTESEDADIVSPTTLSPSHTVNGNDHSNNDPSTDIPGGESPSGEQDAPQANGCISKTTPAAPAAEASPVKPKKLLHFNPKTGTIGSPPKPKTSRVAAEEPGDIGTKPAGRSGRRPASKIVLIPYGSDPESRARLGGLINTILNRQAQQSDFDPKQRSKGGKTYSAKGRKTTSPKASKVTHPFFLGQAKKSGPAPADTQPNKLTSDQPKAQTKHFSSTPCSPRKARTGPAPKIPMPHIGVKSLGLRFPGAKLPAWPWKGMVHARGDDAEIFNHDIGMMSLRSRRSKGNAVKIPLNESVISLVTRSIDVPGMEVAARNINTDEAIPPPPELRLPQKHFESGSKLQSRIFPELKTFRLSPPTRNLTPHQRSSQENDGAIRVPPQLSRLFNSIPSSLSAFDMSQCETATWAQKYAPTSAVEILQPGREALLLRDWLQALMVQSVDTGSVESEKSMAGSKAKGPGAGKKKRRKKQDGFIVSSEDEDDELHDLSDEDDAWAPSGSRGILRKTVVRSANQARGTANTLVISGPHGCGKTAAVYAVAKELGFEIFEINASSRRGGKDVLERIGDMTRNHHVQQHQSITVPDEESPAAEDNTAKDIKTGKQSTMQAFFKTKTTGNKAKQSAGVAAKGTQSEAKKETPKTQRQSLILLEEVDILYDEDKQFWTTVVGLIAQAKRPFIMTCNDETLVPLHTLRLHGIFRFSTPPRDLSVDRLLLIAANEGHALSRQSVEQLYDSRHQDLRAATMDLQYWCQIGVGDRRGGFDWFYPRWPRGVDLDENKEVVRVVSQDAYRPGMNLLGRDSIVDPTQSPRRMEEEVLHQTWHLWGLDVGDWQDSVGLESWAEGLGSGLVTPSADRLCILEGYGYLADAMSAADICSFKAFAAFTEEAMDTTQPELLAKAREDFVLGITHLETPIMTHHDTLTTSIAFAVKSLAKSSLQLHTERLSRQPAQALSALDEGRAIQCLQASFTTTLPGTPAINRMDFAFAFDPIATADTSLLQPMSYLEPSVFDRTLKIIALDVAPFVRGIVAHDSRLQRQRLKMSNLVCEGGKPSQGTKRMRTTRSAFSALEGGSRSTTRGERWFKADMNQYLVAKTAGERWNSFRPGGLETPEKSVRGSAKGSPNTSSPDVTPTKTMKKAVLKSGKRKMALGDDDEADELGC
ncbi:P-loop containing nucleoside triphosphate hydrolase protein [Parathielavia appendiculata]|uniref:P-loop containing nucleoside triphosphate hydrolase protein n=1 Tax=Parathielavia appendiculata TaxID=2587402 RepID=A0AAN6TT11_9PEZI|nr:P-loop containing nucleoside triphosphate hydrolase protein [Parathielavia appendiculata]